MLLKLKNNFYFTIFATLGLFLPDLFLGHYCNLISARLSFHVTATFFLALFWISGGSFRKIFCSVVWAFQTIHAGYWLYFGLPIHSHDLPKIWQETAEISETLKDIPYELWMPYAVTSFLSGTSFFLACRYKTKSWPMAWLSLFIMPFYFWIKGPKMFYVQRQSCLSYATLRAVSNYLVHGVQKPKKIVFKPYIIRYTSPVIKKIVLIMGESMNPKYSYSPLTTPFLYSLKPFWRVGISAAVTTRESLELFFNSVREKDNLDLLQNQTANLFRLAKHQGYMTTLLSAQNENLLSRCGLRFVDHFISSETMEAPPSRYTDEKLLEYVQKIQWNPLHLVVLHVRHAHSPYSEFFKGESQGDSRQDKTIDAYKKAMRYHDAWCKRLFQYLPQDVQVVFVSDHGEMMGEEGLYGHEFEHPLVHCIPVWTYPYKVLPASHFEIAQTLAKWMGVEVKNPNS